MKRFIFLLIVLLATASFSSCNTGGMDDIYTPPIATPNQNIPLIEQTTQDTGGPTSPSQLPDDSDRDSYAAEPSITADPYTIYVQGSGKVTDSKIKVASGTFNPNSYVTVYGEVSDLDAVESPPLIPEDMLASSDGSQIITDSEGGMEFTLRAGASAGVFRIFVQGSVTEFVIVTILE